MKTLSIVNPCFNEEGNVRELYERVRAVMTRLGAYRYEHIFIDNSSADGTAALLKELAASDRNVKVIVNTRNFGHIRSPFHAMLLAGGDAVISLASDLQDPPELIEEMVRLWENGMPVVIAVKNASEESGLMFRARTKYYRLVNRVSNIETYQHFTGFGLYDRKVMDFVREFKDPYPYFRGMIAEIGLPHAEIPYHQPRRKKGHHQEQCLYPLRSGHAGHHQPVEGAAAAGDFFRICQRVPVHHGLLRLRCLQAAVLE